jgi:hypothetical protein
MFGASDWLVTFLLAVIAIVVGRSARLTRRSLIPIIAITFIAMFGFMLTEADPALVIGSTVQVAAVSVMLYSSSRFRSRSIYYVTGRLIDKLDPEEQEIVRQLHEDSRRKTLGDDDG